MRIYASYKDAFGASDSDGSLEGLLHSLNGLPVELRDTPIYTALIALEKHAKTLDGIDHYVEWRAAAKALLPGTFKYPIPSRLESTFSDTAPYIFILKDMIGWLDTYNTGSPFISQNILNFPFFSQQTLVDSLNALRQDPAYTCSPALESTLCGSLRGERFKEVEGKEFQRAGMPLIRYWKRQLDVLHDLDHE